MKTIKVYYLLDEAGRKASILAGGNGKRVQVVEVDPTPEWLALAKVSADGDATAHVGYVPRGERGAEHEPAYYVNSGVEVRYAVRKYERPPLLDVVREQVEFSTPQTPEMLFAWEAARPGELEASKARAEAELRPLLAAYEEHVAAERAEKAAKIEARLQELEAGPDDALLDDRDMYIYDLRYGEFSNSSDPRVLALHERAKRAVEARERARATAKICEMADAAAWVREHGSARLRLALAAGLLAESLGVYRDERLAAERPGWEFGEWEEEEPRNPPACALRALVDARALFDPAVRLVWTKHVHDEDCSDGVLCTTRGFYRLVATYLGRAISRDVG